MGDENSHQLPVIRIQYYPLVSYQYDANGNLLSDGEFDYTYGSANRLTEVTAGALTTEYQYNGDGVRIAQIADGLRTATVQDIAAPLPQLLTARIVTKYPSTLRRRSGQVCAGWGSSAKLPFLVKLAEEIVGGKNRNVSKRV